MIQPVARQRRNRGGASWISATLRRILTGALGVLAATAEVRAQNAEWVVGVGNYEDGANWNPSGEPDSATSILINNGGTAESSGQSESANVTIGGGSTLAILPGINSQFSATGSDFNVGESGTGTVTIGTEALLAAGDLILGVNPGSTGVVTADGASISSFRTYIGYAGTGRMTLDTGTTVESTRAWVGFSAGSQGTVELKNNSTWTAAEGGSPVDINVGYNGAGEVHAADSDISVLSLQIGRNSGSTGTVTVNQGSVTASYLIEIGNAGSGTLGVSNSSIVNSDGVTIGVQAGSTGNVTVENSLLKSTSNIFVGLSGNGTLLNTNGQVEAPEIFVARNPGSTGSMTINGGTATLTGELHVGAEGHGTFTLTGDGALGNGVLQTNRANMGFAAGSTGIMNVDNASWTNTRAIFVGVSGNGTLQIGPGATVVSESGYLAQEQVGIGTVNMTGGNWTMSNTLAVGVNGTGNFSASNGSQVSAPFGQLGLNSSSIGVVTLNNSSWTNSTTLTIGVMGDGQFFTSNGSTLTSPSILLGSSALTTGLLNVTNSTVNTVSILPGGGNGTVTLSGARLNLLGGSSVLDTDLISGFAPGAVTIGAGGLTIDTQGGNAQIASSLAGTGSLTKTGLGRLRLNEANTYTGGTTVEGGLLELTGDSNIGNGNVTLRTAELSAYADTTLSGDLNGGIQLISVAGGQTGTFSAAAGQTLTLAPLDFLLVAGSTMQTGSTGKTGNVVFAPTGATALTADSEINVAAGTLTAGNSALAFLTTIANSTTVASGATLAFQDQVGSGIQALFGAGTVNIGSQSSTMLVVNSGNFAGNIAGNGGLVKESSGTLVLSGQNALIGGTTVNAGTLIVNGDLSFGMGQATVNPGATLGGNGILGTIFLEGGTVAPGNSAGTLTAQNLYWESGNLVFDLGPTSDLLSVGGLQGLGTTYDFTFVNNGWSVNTTYTLISFVGTNFTSADAFRFTNTGGFDGHFELTGNSLEFTLTAIPEPSTWALLAGTGLIWFTVRLRRRIQRPIG
ncbi:MAG: autotransporter-associated beta strand repeat-containing protein [Terrimicrobiaceae bacterium]|nr:autotransporter-associated beta strand repeat-containing protein [Terrimicrobiaceae bacterium]